MITKNSWGRKIILALVVAYAMLLTWSSLAKIVVQPLDFRIEWGDKVAHCIAYFVFTILWFFNFFLSKKHKSFINVHLIRAGIICFLYGFLMEILQKVLTNYRIFDWYDALANTSGIIFAVILIKSIENKLVRETASS